MRKAQDGDRRAYASLLSEVSGPLRGFFRKRLRETEWIDDVLQETLISIHRDRHSYDPSRQFFPWMFAIARHRLIDFVRKERRNSQHEVLTETGLEEVEATSTFEFLHRALARLSKKQREIIQMLKLEELSVKEVSEQMGMSESSVKVTAHRGYKSLRALLKGQSHED